MSIKNPSHASDLENSPNYHLKVVSFYSIYILQICKCMKLQDWFLLDNFEKTSWSSDIWVLTILRGNLPKLFPIAICKTLLTELGNGDKNTWGFHGFIANKLQFIDQLVEAHHIPAKIKKLLKMILELEHRGWSTIYPFHPNEVISVKSLLLFHICLQVVG